MKEIVVLVIGDKGNSFEASALRASAVAADGKKKLHNAVSVERCVFVLSATRSRTFWHEREKFLYPQHSLVGVLRWCLHILLVYLGGHQKFASIRASG